MALTRYEIRNEYRLADPELYRAADKDDPEALLEGVAMAGLVGLLRQLGDLSEFAAEIFHNLHEEVMATAARGHGLTLRVQQLEAEFPSIEKAFLSQASHALFLHNSGVGWHPNPRLDQSVMTQGDLPHFVMDSYEECRGPPRLFLLDKFDIAGAGACLKRYTDPAFFKTEFIISKAEKKSRKIKKKGSHWRIGENPEVTASHFKLHQFLLEEHCQSQINVNTHHMKLKRRFSNNSLVNSTSGKSYMEKLLNSHSPDRKIIYGSSTDPLCLELEYSNINDLVSEGKIPEQSLAKVLVTKDKSPMRSHSRYERVVKDPLVIFVGDVTEEMYNKGLESGPEVEIESIPVCKIEDEKEMIINAKGNTEARAAGYHSDDANSEIDNYTDALTTMDSEMETDSESKSKKERNFKIDRKFVDSETYEKVKELQAELSDSSIGSSTVSEDRNDPLEKGQFSSYSETPRISAENMLSGCGIANKHSSAISQNVDVPSEKPPEIRSPPVTKSPEHAVSNSSCNEVSEIPSDSSSFKEATCGSDVVDTVTGQILPISESERNGSQDLSCPTNASEIPSPSRRGLLSVGFHECQIVGMLDGGNFDAAYDTSTHLSNNLGLAREEKDVDDDIENSSPPGVADDSYNENQMTGKLDSPDSVLLNTETDLYGLAEQDLEARQATTWAPICSDPDFPIDGDVKDAKPDSTVVNFEKIVPSREKSCNLASVLNPENDVFREQKDLKIIDPDMAGVGISDSVVETSCNTLDSSMPNFYSSTTGISCNNIESKMSDYEKKDGHVPGRVHVNSAVTDRGGDISHELQFMCTLSDMRKSVSTAEASARGADSNDVEDTGGFYNSIGSSNGDTNQDKLEITMASDASFFTRLNAEKEVENQFVLTDYNMTLCNVERTYHPSLNDAHDPLMVECTSTRLDVNEGTEVSSSEKESSQKEVLKQPVQSANVKEILFPSSNSLDPGSLLKQASELHALESNLWILQQNGVGSKSSSHEYVHEESSSHLYSDACTIAPSKSYSVGPPRQPSDLNFLSPISIYEFERSDHSVSPSQPNCQGSDLRRDASNQEQLDPQPHRAVLNISLPNDNVVQGSLEETPPLPPLPPLPPMQWRIGKFRHDSRTFGGHMTVPSFNASTSLSAETTDWMAPQGFPTFRGESAEPLNSLSQHPTSDVINPQHGSEILRSEVTQPSLSPSSLFPLFVSDVEYQNVRSVHPILEATTVKPLNPSLPLIDWDLPHGSVDSTEEMLEHTSLDRSTSASTSEDLDHRRVYLTSQQEHEKSMNSLPHIEYKDDENSVDLEGATMQPRTSSAPPTIEHENAAPTIEHENAAPTIEHENTPPTIENNKHEHDSQAWEGELKWQSNSSEVITAVDSGQPNGSLKSRLSRPRDPLIEAVAAHDKSNLRKVTERIIPQIGSQLSERNSLLEQIRRKSFNLKPAVATRPSIHGPKTNLKVVAILEKANAIRQALAGSDEDEDEDSWSDS